MTENKDSGCCGGGEVKNANGCGCCCKFKKIILAILVVGISFMAGMMFAKSCPFGQAKMCPISSK